MVSKIEDTWMKLHPQPTQVKTKASFLHPLLLRLAQFVLSFRLQQHHNQRRNLKLQKRHSQSTLAMKSKKVWLPNSVKDVFNNEVQVPEDNDIATTENVAHVAMLLFAGYIDAATSMSESCGGGGSTPSSGWGKKTMKMTGSLLIVAHRWLMPCASLNHAAEVSTDKSMIIWQSEKAR